MAVFLFHSFRQDGIERNPRVVESEGVVPFAVTGTPFYKHRLVLKYLVPSNNYLFPNESLSQVEMVNTNNQLTLFIALTLSNPIFLFFAYSPALICFERERVWWITCNYPTV
jgi:hypothetical protein